MQELLARGRAEGAFRTDLPESWMVATFFLQPDARGRRETGGGRLDGQDAGHLLATTLLAAFGPASSTGWDGRAALPS